MDVRSLLAPLSKTTQYPGAQSGDIPTSMWSVFWVLVETPSSFILHFKLHSEIFSVCLCLCSLPGRCDCTTTQTRWKSSCWSEGL